MPVLFRRRRAADLDGEEVEALGLPARAHSPLRIEGMPADKRYYIDVTPAMPRIELRAEADGVPMGERPTFTWTFALAYPGYIVVRSGQRRINARAKTHAPIQPIVTSEPSVVVPFAVLMGGELVVTLSATIGGRELETSEKILIGGTNPKAADLNAVLRDPIVRQMVMQESGRKQFSDAPTRTFVQRAINPSWSSDNLRGVGLGQLTVPPPTDSDIWNWRTNAQSLQQRFAEKRRGGTGFARRVAASTRFQAEVVELNAWRAAEGQPPVQVTALTLDDDQLDREGLRGYNGFGPKVPGQYLPHVHEYEPAREPLTSGSRKDARGQPLVSKPLLVVDDQGAIEWWQISGAERRNRYVAAGKGVPGEPDYVAQVLAQPQ